MTWSCLFPWPLAGLGSPKGTTWSHWCLIPTAVRTQLLYGSLCQDGPPAPVPSLQPGGHGYGECQGHCGGSSQDLGLGPRGGVAGKTGTEGGEDGRRRGCLTSGTGKGGLGGGD